MGRKIKIIEDKATKKVDPLQRQKYVWLAGHALTLTFGLLFAATYVFHVCLFYKYRSWKWLFLKLNKNYSIISGDRWYHSLLRYSPNMMYHLSLIGTFLSCGITLNQEWAGLDPQYFELLSSENFQYLLISVLWFFSRKSIYKLCPFLILSYLHITNSQMEFKGACNIGEVGIKNARLLQILAFSELVVAFALLLDALLLKDGTAGITLVLYLGIYWLRINFSPYVQATLLKILTKFDTKVPPKYKDKWSTIKKFIYVKSEDHKNREETLVKTA